MKITTWLVGLATGMLLLTGPVPFFVHEDGNATSISHPNPEEVSLLVFSPLSLGQKVLLAAASVFYPEAAENALIRYFHPTSDFSSSLDDTAMVGIQLEDGRYMVINPNSLPSMASEEPDGAHHPIRLEGLEDGWFLTFDSSTQETTTPGESEANSRQVHVQFEDGWSLIFEPNRQLRTGPAPLVIGQVLPSPSSETDVQPQAIIHWHIVGAEGETESGS